MANALTILRVVLIPVFAYVKISSLPGHDLIAAAIFGLAALTDLFDGMIARRTGTVTDFGKVADPLADRALILAVLGVLVLTGRLPLWPVAVVAVRDAAMVVGYRIAQKRDLKPEVSPAGKVSTAGLMIAIVLVILAVPGAVVAFYVAAALSVVSGLQYAYWMFGASSSAAVGNPQETRSGGEV